MLANDSCDALVFPLVLRYLGGLLEVRIQWIIPAMKWFRSFLEASWRLDFSEPFPAMRWFGCCLDVSGRVLEGGCQRMHPAMYSLCLCLEVSWRVLEFNFLGAGISCVALVLLLPWGIFEGLGGYILARKSPALRCFCSCLEVSWRIWEVRFCRIFPALR